MRNRGLKTVALMVVVAFWATFCTASITWAGPYTRASWGYGPSESWGYGGRWEKEETGPSGVISSLGTAVVLTGIAYGIFKLPGMIQSKIETRTPEDNFELQKKQADWNLKQGKEELKLEEKKLELVKKEYEMRLELAKKKAKFEKETGKTAPDYENLFNNALVPTK